MTSNFKYVRFFSADIPPANFETPTEPIFAELFDRYCKIFIDSLNKTLTDNILRYD